VSLIVAALLATIAVLLTHVWFPEVLPSLLGFLASRIWRGHRKPRPRAVPTDPAGNGTPLDDAEFARAAELEETLEVGMAPREMDRWQKLAGRLGEAGTTSRGQL
jgi:hypothetical protein